MIAINILAYRVGRKINFCIDIKLFTHIFSCMFKKSPGNMSRDPLGN